MLPFRLAAVVTAQIFCVSSVLGPLPAAADALSDAGRSGQVLGDALRSGASANLPGYDAASQTLTVNGGALPESDLIQLRGSRAEDRADMQNLTGNAAAMSAFVSSTADRLQTEGSAQGSAYRTVINSRFSNRTPNLLRDPVFAGSRQILNRGAGTLFAGCSTTVSTTRTTRQVHVEDMESCTRVTSRLGNCTAARNLYFQLVAEKVVMTYMGPVETWGVAEFRVLEAAPYDLTCTNCDLGTVAAEASAAGGLFSAYTDYASPYASVRLSPMGTAELPTLAAGEVYVARMQVETLPGHTISDHVNVNTPPTAANGWKMGLDVLTLAKGRQDANYQLRLQIFKGHGDVIYDPVTCAQFIQAPAASCVQSGWTCTDPLYTTEQQCTTSDAGETCTEVQVPVPPRVVNGFTVDLAFARDNQLPQLYPDEYASGRVCWNARVETTVCAEEDCSALISRGCRFRRSQCAEDSPTAATGNCDVHTDYYDCGIDQPLASFGTQTSLSCSGVRCMGGDCLDLSSESSRDFESAATALETMKGISQDLDSCTGSPSDCRIFGGERQECKVAMGGMQNCCKKPGSTSLVDYIQMIHYMGKFNDKYQVLGSMPGYDQATGAWSAVKEGTAQVWSDVSGSFMSGIDQARSTVFGPLSPDYTQDMWTLVDPAEQASLNLSSVAGGNMSMSNVYEGLNQALPDPLGSKLFSVTEDGITTLSPGMESLLGGIGTAYMYYQMVVVLVQLIWPCTQDEFKLGADRELHVCHAVGSYCATQAAGICLEKRETYCCYKSPLARILQEQYRGALAMSFGTGRNPECGGLSADLMNQVDSSRIDLSEWFALQQMAGIRPADIQAVQERFSMGTLSSESNFVSGQRSPNAAERLEGAMGGTTEPTETARSQVRDSLY